MSRSKWPSIHGTVRRGSLRDRVWDIVFEADHGDWTVAFESVRPLVQVFMRMGIPFFVKYSGRASAHVIIPGELLRPHVRRFSDLRGVYGRIYKFAKKHMKRPNLLDMSFLTSSRHYLRVAYSIHEKTGKVSLPILPQKFDSFNPMMAQPQSAEVMQNWWHIPENADEYGKKLMAHLSRRK